MWLLTTRQNDNKHETTVTSCEFEQHDRLTTTRGTYNQQNRTRCGENKLCAVETYKFLTLRRDDDKKTKLLT